MKLERELGGYSRWQARLYGSFRTNTTNPPDNLRDGKSKLIASVVRVSAGLFTVTLNQSVSARPKLMVLEKCYIDSADPPVKVCQAQYVTGSWSPSAKTFQIVVVKTGTVGGAAAAPVIDDPDAHARIGFELVGSISQSGTDAA